jgi:beta-lactamase regulating signal transducer with metallopeptidase domain
MTFGIGHGVTLVEIVLMIISASYQIKAANFKQESKFEQAYNMQYISTVLWIIIAVVVMVYVLYLDFFPAA